MEVIASALSCSGCKMTVLSAFVVREVVIIIMILEEMNTRKIQALCFVK